MKVTDVTTLPPEFIKEVNDLIAQENLTTLIALCQELGEHESMMKKSYENVFTFLSMIPIEVAQKGLQSLCNKRENRKFWNEKIAEDLLDDSGSPIPANRELIIDGRPLTNILRWEKIVISLCELHVKRQKEITSKLSGSITRV